MLQGKWLRTLAMATAISSILMQGCKKENGIDNNNVISTPYALYYTDNQGALFNTNDGLHGKIIFPTDGWPQRAIAVSDTNVLFVKKNLHLSTDNGNNFNPTDLSVTPTANWQSIIINVTNQDNRLYLASTRGYGILISDDHGISWQVDTMVDKDNITSPFYPTSFAQLKGGNLFAFSNGLQKLYKRTSKSDRWHEVAMTGLPAHTYFLSHQNEALIAADVSGSAGVYYSNDNGQNWYAYAGLPAGSPIHAAYSPFERQLLVGTNLGIYRLQSGNFVPSNAGLAAQTIVYSITGKTDIYKNGVIKEYVYIATSTGLYRSEDEGQNWVFMPDDTMPPNGRHDLRLVY